MKYRARAKESPGPPTLRAVRRESQDEISSVRPAFRMVCDIDIEPHDDDRAPTDPTAVYATPRLLVHGERIAFLRPYYLGTRFPTGIVASTTWEREMVAEGVAQRLIDRCKEFLRRRTL
jgi:hypothetical protein